MVSMPSRQTTNADAARSSRHSYLPNCSRMAIRVAYYFSYRAYLVLYWPDSDFENHLQLDALVEPVTERRALGAFINLMGKAGYAPISISRQYGILRGSHCTSKAARQSVGSWGGLPHLQLRCAGSARDIKKPLALQSSEVRLPSFAWQRLTVC
jgi:hypothetical protein